MNKPKSPYLTHRVSGRGEPLLLLNGALMSFAAWQPLMPRLEASWKVIRCDLRGQFFSPGEAEPSLDAHVRDVLALVSHLGLTRFHVAGVSFGSFVALRLAARSPERIISVTPITSTDYIRDESWALLEPLRDALLAVQTEKVFDLSLPMFGPDYVEQQKEMMGLQKEWIVNLPEIWYRGVGQILVAVKEIDMRADLPAIRCPALVISAEHDRIFPPEQGKVLAGALRNARLETVAGAGHNLIVEKPAAVADLLTGFLSKQRPGGWA
jgi:3-oxoadipate enol-lactonase